MKHLLLTSTAILALGLSGCSTTPEATDKLAKTDVVQVEKASEAKAKDENKKESKKQKGLTKTFAATPEEVKTATLVAMKKLGFNIKKEEGLKFEGKRTHKIGLAVGSGGEKMYAKVIPMDGAETAVHVRTKKTFVGIVGQKNWDDEVLELITESLEDAKSSDVMETS